MGVVSRESFGVLLRSLDDGELAQFTADLWSARGFETAVDGRRVLVRNGPTIWCGRSASGPDPWSAGVDIRVTARPVGRHEHPPTTGDIRVLGPADLRGMLLYAIDRRTAERLFEAHFDRPLTADDTSSRLPSVSGWERVGLVLLFVAGVLLAGLAMADFGIRSWDDGGSATGQSAGTGQGSGAGVTPVATDRYPPGVGPSGITDTAALAAAHRAAAGDARWDLLLVHRGSEDLLNPDKRWAGARLTVDRHNRSHFWFRVTGSNRTGTAATETVIYDDYADGRVAFRRVAATPRPRYTAASLPDRGDGGVFTAVTAAYIERYLDTATAEVETIDFGAVTRYRVVATGAPDGMAPVSNYTAVAVLDSRGFVYRLSVEFERLHPPAVVRPGGTPGSNPPTVTADPTETVQLVMVFRDVGSASVGEPAWYDDARRATNGTPTGEWPNDPPV